MDHLKGYFMELQNLSVNDGEGIRTIIFFAGCPLNCQWCSNPESLYDVNRVSFYKRTCIECGNCTDVCPETIGIDLNRKENRSRCLSCGKCVKVCPTNSRKHLIHQYTVDEILETIEKQSIFYRFSNGGVTFSGGEATRQPDILRYLTKKLYDQGINLAVETSGYFDFESIKDIFKKMDLIFIDLKHMDRDIHKQYTGVYNDQILENIEKFNTLNIPIVIRIPIIEGFNAAVENIKETAEFVKNSIDNPKIELLPYHRYGEKKYEALGLNKPSKIFEISTDDKIKRLKEIIKNAGVKVIDYQ